MFLVQDRNKDTASQHEQQGGERDDLGQSGDRDRQGCGKPSVPGRRVES